MKKITFALLAFFLSFSFLYSQTLVTTTPQCKNAMLEEYTGIHCGYCPDGHKIAELIKQEFPKQVVLINIHQGGYATPGTGEPDFRTSFGDLLSSQAGVTGYPSGTVNRHYFPKLSAGSTTSMNRGSWYNAAKELIGIQSPVNVGFKSEFDTATRELTVQVELYYTLNSPSTTNYLNVAFLENHVFAYQSDYANGNHTDYDHKHIMRHLITGQWGDIISNQTTKGTLVKKTYKYTVPANFKIENCDVVVYVAESQQEIYTAVQAPAVSGANSGEGATFIGEFNNIGVAFKKGQASQPTTFSITAQSAFVTAQDFVLKLTNDAPAGWTGNFTVDGTPYTDSALVNMTSASKNITISATPGTNPGLATYTLSLKSVANPTASIKKYEVNVISGITDLIVNNDASWGNAGDTNSAFYQQSFKDGLQTAGINSYTATSLSVFEKGSSSNGLQGVKNLYYNVGWSFPALTDSNVAKFQSFLDNGGNMLISGQDVGWETFNTTNTSYSTPNTKAFVTNYLKASWVDDGSSALNNLTAITGESVFKISGNSAITNVYGNNPADNKPFMYPDVVNTVSNGQPIFYYNADPTKIAAVRSCSNKYKTVYMAVSLEMIADATVRNQIMKLAYDWFNGSITAIEYDNQMKDLMGQNYPNPANSYTTIPLNNVDRQMQINLIDINGKVMQSIRVEKGTSSVKIDCSNLKSGIYLIKLLDQNTIINTRRLVIAE